MLTAAEFATQLGLSARAVYDLAESGALAHYRLGAGQRAIRFDQPDVDAYRRAQQKHAAPTPSPKALRHYLRLYREAAFAGDADGLPELTAQQVAIADSRRRNQRMAPWASGRAIRAIYAEARKLTEATGVLHHVDHVIPLQGELVTGLHVETNLQIITASDNLKKRNRYEDGEC